MDLGYRRLVRYATRAIAVVAMAAVDRDRGPGQRAGRPQHRDPAFGSGGSTITVAGCQAKGLRVSAAPKSSGAGLAPGTYLYTVSAVLAGGETPACAPLAVTTTVSDNSAVLQWNAVPGALGYRVYRNDGTASPATLRAVFISAGNTVVPPSACPMVGRADKCVFQDNGNPQDVTKPPTLIAPTSQGGAHADVNLVQTIDYGSDTFDSAPSVNDRLPQVGRLPPSPGLQPEPKRGAHVQARRRRAVADRRPCEVRLGRFRRGHLPQLDAGRHHPDHGRHGKRSLGGRGRHLQRRDPGGELARLFIVLRPLCSAGNLVASPGSATCNTSLGGTNRQVEKSFLAGVARMVDRGGGVLGLDVETVEAETGGPIPPYLNVLVPSPTALARLDKVRLSLRQLTPHLFGVADQGTASTADDQPFVTLPIFCGVQSLSGEITTYTDTTPATGSISIAVFPCEEPPPPPPPPPPGTPPPPPGTTPPPGGGETLPAFGTKTLVTLRLAAKRIPARGPLKVRVANANGFAITGALSGRTVNKVSVSLLRRIS